MAQPDQASEQLKQYLAQFAPQVRGRLLAELERLHGLGETTPSTEELIATLRAEFREPGQGPERIGEPARLFFQPLEDVLIDGAPERTNSGQIARGSLGPIWSLLKSELLVTMAREYVTNVSKVDGQSEGSREAGERLPEEGAGLSRGNDAFGRRRHDGAVSASHVHGLAGDLRRPRKNVHGVPRQRRARRICPRAAAEDRQARGQGACRRRQATEYPEGRACRCCSFRADHRGAAPGGAVAIAAPRHQGGRKQGCPPRSRPRLTRSWSRWCSTRSTRSGRCSRLR